jgi:NAD+ kinase
MRIGCVSNPIKTDAVDYMDNIINKYNLINLDIKDEKCDVVIVLGGDGTMLRAIHKYMHHDVKFFGMNFGTIGFLMNRVVDVGQLIKTIENAIEVSVPIISNQIMDSKGIIYELNGINELSVLRTSHNAANLRISIDSIVRMEKLLADGIVISTPIGSTAYNFSLHGQILPVESNLLSMMPVSPFRPRHWRGALISNKSSITIDVLDHQIRTVNASVDFYTIQNVAKIESKINFDKQIKLLYDKDCNIHQKLLNEQFSDLCFN